MFLSYVIALLFTALILTILYGAINTLLSTTPFAEKLSAWTILQFFGLLVLFIVGANYFSDIWRSHKDDLKLGFTDIPNPFYDPNYIKAPHFLKKENERLLSENKELRQIVNSYDRMANKFKEINEDLTQKTAVLMRHHDNSSRLLASATYLLYKGHEWQKEMLNNILSECLTCLEKDQSDKSVSLFRVDKDEPEFRKYDSLKT